MLERTTCAALMKSRAGVDGVVQARSRDPDNSPCLTSMEECPAGQGQEYARHRREIADVAVHYAEKYDDGGLVGGDRIEVAHLAAAVSSVPHS